jgi:hypothetical protein
VMQRSALLRPSRLTDHVNSRSPQDELKADG